MLPLQHPLLAVSVLAEPNTVGALAAASILPCLDSGKAPATPEFFALEHCLVALFFFCATLLPSARAFIRRFLWVQEAGELNSHLGFAQKQAHSSVALNQWETDLFPI